MFACRWFRVLAVVSSVAKAVHGRPGDEVGPTNGLHQTEVETILTVQSNLRRQLINSLADVGEKIIQFEGFHSVVNDIIQDLQSRRLDPFKSFKHGVVHEQSTPSGMAETIHNLQGPTTLADWKSLLQTIPLLPSQPDVKLTLEHLEKIHRADEPFVAVVLTGIQKNYIKVTKRLLRDVLYNYRFRDSDSEMISDNLNRMLQVRPMNFSDFRPDPTAKGSDAILSDVLKYIARKSDSGVAHQIAQLLPAISRTSNVVSLDAAPDPYRLFDLMLEDDYPADIVQAKNALSSAVKTNQIGLDLSEVGESLRGRPPMEKLLMLIAKLTSLPGGAPFRKRVHAVYPHVKLRHLASRGKFFRPRTASDVGFLLGSFLTSPDESNPTLFREIRKLFSDFNWEEGLKDFDYSRYSRPRPLVLDMFEQLLNNSNKLPVCGVILLGYFLRKNHREVSVHARNDDILIEELLIPMDKTRGRYPTRAMSTTESLVAVERCPDGPPVRIVDPESIIEALGPNRYSDFVSTLIRFRPMPIGHPESRRIDIFRTVLKSLRNSGYDDDAIEKILSEMPFNEKADLPPKYLNLCPSEVAAMEAQRPSTVSQAPSLSVDSFTTLFAPSGHPIGFSAIRKTEISPLEVSLIPETSLEETVSTQPATVSAVPNTAFPASLVSLLNSSTLASPSSASQVLVPVATTPFLVHPTVPSSNSESATTSPPVVTNVTPFTEKPLSTQEEGFVTAVEESSISSESPSSIASISATMQQTTPQNVNPIDWQGDATSASSPRGPTQTEQNITTEGLEPQRKQS